jgi:hypothetical protein
MTVGMVKKRQFRPNPSAARQIQAAGSRHAQDPPAKNGLAAGAGGVTVAPAMKTLSTKAKIVELPFVK